MTSNFLSTLDFTVSHPDSGSTATGATDNGGNPGDTQPIPKGSPSPDRSPLGSNTSTKLFANAGENEMESSEFERVLVSTDVVFYKNQADDIRSNMGDLRTVWSQETISITPKKHNNRLAELIKQVREFKADNHKDDEGEQNSITEEADVNGHRNRKHDIDLIEIMEKLVEHRSEITMLRSTMESERNSTLVLRHDIEVHKQELLREIEVQKTHIERQQEAIQKELKACIKEREESDDNIREANVRESIEAAREAQIAQYREEVTNLQKFFDERIQKMSSEHKTYEQTVQQLNTKLLEYENEITKLRNEMETERKHIQGPPTPVKEAREENHESRTNHESDSRKSNQKINDRTERFETSDSKPTIRDSSNKGNGNKRQRNKLDTDEIQRREGEDDYILEPGEDVGNRELFMPPSDMIDNRCKRPTTTLKEKSLTPENILHKDYAQKHIDRDEYSNQEIPKTDEDGDAGEDCNARDSHDDYGYDNYGYQDYQEAQTKFPSESELNEILNGGDESVKLYKMPGKNFNGACHHSVDTMVSQNLMHGQDTRHVWSDVTNTHATVDQTRNIWSYDANMHTVHAQNNVTLFPRIYGSLDVIQEESIPSSPDKIDPDVFNATHIRDKQQQPCDPHLKKDGAMLPSELVGRSLNEQNAQDFPSQVCNENLEDLDLKGLTYRVRQSTSDEPSPENFARDTEEAYNTRAENGLYHDYLDDSTIVALKKEIGELRKDFEKTKNDDQTYLKEATVAEIEKLKKDIETLKMVLEKDEDKNKTYPETEDDKLIESLRNEVQQLKKNLEKIENLKPALQPNYEDVIGAIRKEIEAVKKEQEKNTNESNTSAAEDMGVVIELLKKEIESIKNDPEKGQDRESTALIYEDVIRRLQDDIEKLKLEHEKPIRKLNTSTNADDDLALGSILKETEKLMARQKERQDLEKTASLLEANLETLKSDFDTMKKEQKQRPDREKEAMYETEINAIRNEISAIKASTRNTEQESLRQVNDAEMDYIKKELDALREKQEKLKTQLMEINFDPLQTNQEAKVTKTNDLEAKKLEKEMNQLKEITTTNTDYGKVIDSLRNDIDQLKEDQMKIFMVNEEQENRRQLDETYIGAIRKEMDGLKRDQEKLKQHLDGRKAYSLTPHEEDIIDTLRKDLDALKMEKQSQPNPPEESMRILEALKSEVDSLRKVQDQLQNQETDSSTLTPGPSDAEEPVLYTIKEGKNKEYILRDAFDQLCCECKQRDDEIEACKEDIKKLFELVQNSLARVDNERQMHAETINERLAKYSESINKVLTATKTQSENVQKLVDDTESEKTELRSEVNKYRHLLEGKTLDLQQEVESLKKSHDQVFTFQQEIEKLRTSTDEMDSSTRNKLQELSKLDNDILQRLEKLNAVQEDQTEKIASLKETLGHYGSEIPELHKAMETEREEILDLNRGLQKHIQKLRDDHDTQLTALETHKKEVETKIDSIRAELQELHEVKFQQHKLQKRSQVTELEAPVMKNKISTENSPKKTREKDLGSLTVDDELFKEGLHRKVKVKELEVTPSVDEIVETQDNEERSTISSWYSAVTTRQRRKPKSNSCLGYLCRICCIALPFTLLLLLFLIFALFVPFFQECCTWTNTYRHSPMFFRYVDGPPPI